MNNDLISRSEIERKIEDCFDAWLTGVDCSVCASEIYTSIIDAITKQPAVDAEPVQHGHWDDSFDGITPYCSVCGMSHNCINRTPDYCPHCGARMDGGTKENG